MATLGDMTEQELISSARSEMRGVRDHLGLPDTLTTAEYDALPYRDRLLRAYLSSIDLRLTMLDIHRERREQGTS